MNLHEPHLQAAEGLAEYRTVERLYSDVERAEQLVADAHDAIAHAQAHLEVCERELTRARAALTDYSRGRLT